MLVSPQTTHGGPHPASFYAGYVLNDIIQIAPTAEGQSADEGMVLRGKMASHILESFSNMQEDERSALDVRGSEWLHTPLTNPNEVSTMALRLIQLSEGSVHELHFKQEHVKVHIQNILGHQIATLRDVERKWYMDRKGV